MAVPSTAQGPITHPKRAGSAGKSSPIPHTRLEEEGQFESYYKVGSKLGEGSFGIVREVVHMTTGERWACKVVNKDNHKEKSWGSKIKLLEREVNILKRVNHEHIIRLHEVYETSQKMYLVMSLCEGGELSKELKSRGKFTELETRLIMARLTSAIAYLHKNDMVHRDLKMENILLSTNPDDHKDHLYIKVTDFGLSVVKGGVSHENMMMDFCGTPLYMAPEIIDNKTYSEKCDVWAMGVMLHLLLMGNAPFVSVQDDEKLYEQIKNLDVKEHMVQNYKQWEPITLECKDCLLRMLSIDPAHRLAASEILSHPWITGESLDPANGPRNVLEMMRAWGYQLEDDDTASVSPSESSAIKIQPSINVEEYSSQEGSSGPPSRNGSASSSTAKFSNGSTPQPPRSLSRQRTNSSDLLLPNSNNTKRKSNNSTQNSRSTSQKPPQKSRSPQDASVARPRVPSAQSSKTACARTPQATRLSQRPSTENLKNQVKKKSQ